MFRLAVPYVILPSPVLPFAPQCPVVKYHRQLMQAILFDRVKIADAVNVKVIGIEDAPKGYANFDKGASVKYVIDPHGEVRAHLGIKASQI